jgi:hypothetical protein
VILDRQARPTARSHQRDRRAGRWDSLIDGEEKPFIRQATDYVAFLACTDQEIGRVVQAGMGMLDDTGSATSFNCSTPFRVRFGELPLASWSRRDVTRAQRCA